MKQQYKDEPMYSRVCALLADLFNNRHCRRDDVPTATAKDVRKAHERLGLDLKEWPGKDQANDEVLAIQAELDRMFGV